MVSKVTSVDVAPKDLITYTRETQTSKDLLDREGIVSKFLILFLM